MHIFCTYCFTFHIYQQLSENVSWTHGGIDKVSIIYILPDNVLLPGPATATWRIFDQFLIYSEVQTVLLLWFVTTLLVATIWNKVWYNFVKWILQKGIKLSEQLCNKLHNDKVVNITFCKFIKSVTRHLNGSNYIQHAHYTTSKINFCLLVSKSVNLFSKLLVAYKNKQLPLE